MKFPLPVSASGEGLSVGAERRIHFAGGEGKPGELTMRVTGRDASSVTFAAESDTSHIAHWRPSEAHEVWEADYHPALRGWTSNVLTPADLTPDAAARPASTVLGALSASG